MSEAKKIMSDAKMDALFNAVKAALPHERQKAELLAEMRRIYYDASIRKGFTQEQALDLCKHMNF